MRARRLKRRIYHNPGPNHVWHVDGYDKLKPFGFAIHGAIDGWSRKMIWLKVASTNNNPRVVCSYYVEALELSGRLPRLVRMDRGTENVNIAAVQTLLRENHPDPFSENPVRFGSSIHNQRIERWWGYFRVGYVQSVMSLFKDLRDSGILDVSDPMHIACLQFAFTNLLQRELDAILEQWNLHPIRRTRNTECPPGKPLFLHENSEVYGAEDMSQPVDNEILQELKTLCTTKPNMFGCSDEFATIALDVMEMYNLEFPNSLYEALSLFGELRVLVEQ